ncbi:HalOD1 output domain-containing protein [Natronolimnobius baerhuensis]|uniref:HalOD1 output domain-containing protein n=1 Tax=Natronolimnobius baerhuensis TaxID=253108 RepID=UPI0006D2139E|nr:HalOD1 output domain-containing protein [Natronolimnobius baerhuensis]
MVPERPEQQVLIEYEIPEAESVSTAAINAVSSLNDCEPWELRPLYATIDPELLDELCESQQTGTVKFVYSDFHITVENGEYLLLRPAD